MTPHTGDERDRSALRIRREKLYENRSYVRAWRRSRLDPAVGAKGPRPAAPPSAVVALDRGPGRRRVDRRGCGGRRGHACARAPEDLGRRKGNGGESAEEGGDPRGVGPPRRGTPKFGDSVDWEGVLPRRDDGRLEGARRGRRLDAFLHYDAAHPAVRRVRALAVPPPQGRRLRADRQAPGHLVPEGPGADRGPRSPRGRGRDADGIHAAEVPLGRRPVPRRGDDPARDRVRADEPLG